MSSWRSPEQSGILNLLHELWLIHLPLDDHQSTNLTKLKTTKPWLRIGSKSKSKSSSRSDWRSRTACCSSHLQTLAILHKRRLSQIWLHVREKVRNLLLLLARPIVLKTMVISQILFFFFSFLVFPPTGETGWNFASKENAAAAFPVLLKIGGSSSRIGISQIWLKLRQGVENVVESYFILATSSRNSSSK